MAVKSAYTYLSFNVMSCLGRGELKCADGVRRVSAGRAGPGHSAGLQGETATPS